jgi:hypothetical protein
MLGRVIWEAWKAYAHRAGTYQSWVLLNVAYFGVFGPSSLIGRLTGARTLDLDRRPRPSYWLARPPGPTSLEALERQF